MNGFRRILLAFFAICGLVLLAILALPWYGPFGDQARAFLSSYVGYNVVLVLMCIVAVGLIAQLIRAIISRRVNAVNVAIVDGGQIAVTCDAIASTATNIVEQNSSCRVDDVKVKARGKNRVNVRMRLAPYAASDIYDGGAALHSALMGGLGSLCGDALQSVSLQFVEPQTADLTPADAVPINHYGELQESQSAWQPEQSALAQSSGETADYATVPATADVSELSQSYAATTELSDDSVLPIHVETNQDAADDTQAEEVQ